MSEECSFGATCSYEADGLLFRAKGSMHSNADQPDYLPLSAPTVVLQQL